MTNAEVMERFRISAAGYAHLLKQLFTLKLISEQDLERRGIQFRIVSPTAPEKPVERAPLLRPGAQDEDDELLSTMDLTKLLSFKPRERTESETKPEPVREPIQKQEPPRVRKVEKDKSGMSGLFRKAW